MTYSIGFFSYSEAKALKIGIDALFHPVFLELRYSGEMNLYKPFQLEQEPYDAPTRTPRSRKFDIEQLSLDLHIDEEQRSIMGTATIQLKPLLNDLQEVELDAVGLEISRVTFGKEALTFETYPEKLLITLPRAYKNSETISLVINYSARPRKGLFFIAPDKGYPKRPHQVWSQNQPDDSAHWFPCFNYPGDKYRSELRATVKDRFFVISNGKLLKVNEDRAKHTKTYHWQLDVEHSSYLTSLIVGEFHESREKVGETELAYYIYKDHPDKSEKIFGRTPEMLRFFQEKFGYPYPYPKYSQAIVCEFTFGGMENTSATTLTDVVLDWACGDDRTTRDLTFDDLISHELAHQWWGDLVTCKNWHHVWLNEGFASYAEVLWREHAWGKEETAYYRIQDYNEYLRQDLGEARHPLVNDRYHYSVELFDRHAYQKGSLVIHMLRKQMGDEAFFAGLKHYLHKHAFKVVETHDLKIALEEATGQQLDTFFYQWLYRAGFPEFEVTSRWNREQHLLHLSVKQVQKIDEHTPLFQVPVEIEITTAHEKRAFKLFIDRKEADYYFPLSEKPLMVVFDKGDHILKTLNFKKSKEELIYQLKHDEEVAGRMRAARELTSFDDETSIAALQGVLLSETFWGVGVAVAIALGEMKHHRAKEALMAGYRASKQGRVRRACIWGLGNYPADTEMLALLRQAAEKDESDYVAATAYQAIAHTKSEQAADLLLAALSRDSFREVIRAAAFVGLTALKDKRAIEHALKLSEYGKHPSVRDAAIRTLGEFGKENEKCYHQLTELLKDNSWRVRSQTLKALGKTENKAAIPLLKAAEEHEALDSLKSVARAAYHGLEAAK